MRFLKTSLSRPLKQKLNVYHKYKTRKKRDILNHFKAEFGQGMNDYDLDEIRIKKEIHLNLGLHPYLSRDWYPIYPGSIIEQ